VFVLLVGLKPSDDMILKRVSRPAPSLLQKLYENWLKENTQEIFEDKVKKYSKKLGVLTNHI